MHHLTFSASTPMLPSGMNAGFVPRCTTFWLLRHPALVHWRPHGRHGLLVAHGFQQDRGRTGPAAGPRMVVATEEIVDDIQLKDEPGTQIDVSERLERAERILSEVTQDTSTRQKNDYRSSTGSRQDATDIYVGRRKREATTIDTDIVTGEQPGRPVYLSPTAPSRTSDLVEENAARIAKSGDPGPRYDPEVSAARFSGKLLQVRKRQISIATRLTMFVAKVVVDVQMGKEETNRPKRATEFLNIIASLGPAFIKGGQALSSRPDLLPPEYLYELQKLQDRLEPFPNETAFAVIESELGEPVEALFSNIEPVPVAAASIGQVYKAKLRSTGENVAIKVQRPDCEKTIAMDIYILRNLSGTLASLLKLLRREIDLRSVIDEFGKLIYEEIDYLSEARNAERFAELYGEVQDVDCPRIYWRYTNRLVLTMEWIDGMRLTSKEVGRQNSHLVQTMVQCSLRQMLENGYFHADPHGGNLLAARNGKLCYLDFGMMSEVEPEQRYGIIEAVVHMVNRDFDSLARLYVRLGFLPPETNLEPIVNALNDALPDVLSASVNELNFKSVIDKLGSVMYRYPFRLPAYYTAIIRCLGVLEGLAIQVDPTFKILNEAYPYIASRLLTDPAPQLQEALQSLLFKDGRPRWNRLESLLDSAAGTNDYDVTSAADLLISFLLSPKGKKIRFNLADDVTNELDVLGFDLAQYYGGIVAQATNAAGIPLPGFMVSKKIPVRTQSMENMDKFLRVLSKSNGFSPQKVLPLLRKVLGQAEGQRLGLEIAASLAERATSRAVRLAFGLPFSPPMRPEREGTI
eukprot:Plantae.Rhodophyta-Hildenbrandia_rubra.ctg3912.p1 GENE.Plantae.Rhodophyta-Hildenbrandia_rubra.ctg3912~~Plantae.Rhodophyta-Hildenbrandia_rubra.ctg3912.p1  ORF type:complete len:803 (+),score=115.26 Plantae.Rhodophyta-Hildenbrandia_rubra.ctg3912:2914-5322(+)